jgi:hypothetical protein
VSCRLEDLGLDDHSDQLADATPLTFGVPVSIQGHYRRDVDILSFTATEGHVYALTSPPDGPNISFVEVTGRQVGGDNSIPRRYRIIVSGTAYIHVFSGSRIASPFSLMLQDLGPQQAGLQGQLDDERGALTEGALDLHRAPQGLHNLP